MQLQWIISIAIPVSGLVGWIPLASTVVSCVLSVVGARATLRHAETTDKGLARAREEFEREWSPELHIKLERTSATEAKVVVTNLAKISVLLQMIQLRKISYAKPFEPTFLNDALGGMSWTQDVGKYLLACTSDDFEGMLGASLNFYVSGRMFRTGWFRFHIQVRIRHILQIHATNTPARRVRVS
jgi:hypothetical protein